MEIRASWIVARVAAGVALASGPTALHGEPLARASLNCPAPGQGVSLTTGAYVLSNDCWIRGPLDLGGDADLLVQNVKFTVKGPVRVAGDAALTIQGGSFRLDQQVTGQFRIDARDRALVEFRDAVIHTNADSVANVTAFLDARGDATVRFTRCFLDRGRSWLLAFAYERAVIEIEDSLEAPTETFPRDESTIRVSGPSTSVRVVPLVPPDAVALVDDLPTGEPFSYAFGRGRPGTSGIGYLVEVIESKVRWGFAIGPRSNLTIRNSGQPVTMSYLFAAVLQSQLLSGLRVEGPQSAFLGHQGRRLLLENVPFYPVGWQVYVENLQPTAPGLVLIENSIINEIGALINGRVEVRDSILQFGYVAAFAAGSRVRIEDSVINSQSIRASHDGLMEIVESSIWGSLLDVSGTARLRLFNTELNANVCHPGCLPGCFSLTGGNQCNGFNPATKVSFGHRDGGAILAARLVPLTAPVTSGALLPFWGDALVESQDPALDGYTYQISYGPAGAPLIPVGPETGGPKRNEVLGELDTTGLVPGDYVVRLELRVPGEAPFLVERPFVVRSPL